MNNAAFGKAMENVRKQRDIKLVITEARSNYLVSQPNYHKTTFFSGFISNRDEKTQMQIIKPVFLRLSILELSRTVMCEFWYD